MNEELKKALEEILCKTGYIRRPVEFSEKQIKRALASYAPECKAEDILAMCVEFPLTGKKGWIVTENYVFTTSNLNFLTSSKSTSKIDQHKLDIRDAVKIIRNEDKHELKVVYKDGSDRTVYANIFIYDLENIIGKIIEMKQSDSERAENTTTSNLKQAENATTSNLKQTENAADSNPKEKSNSAASAPKPTMNPDDELTPQEQYELAGKYYEGIIDGKVDYSRTVNLLQKAANGGYLEAQVALGAYYANGLKGTLDVDYEKAIYWSQKAAEQGHRVSQHNCGQIYYYGLGVDVDYEKAFYWHEKAAQQEEAASQYMLGLMYREGNGVEADNQKALEWFEKAYGNNPSEQNKQALDEVISKIEAASKPEEKEAASMTEEEEAASMAEEKEAASMTEEKEVVCMTEEEEAASMAEEEEAISMVDQKETADETETKQVSEEAEVSQDTEISVRKEKYDRNKPNINIGIIGHAGHGKTSFISAFTTVLQSRFGFGKAQSVDMIDTDVRDSHGISMRTSYVEGETSKLHLTFIDCPGSADAIGNMIPVASQMDAVIMVVSAIDGPMPQTLEQTMIARLMGVDEYNLTIFINKCDELEDEDIIDLVEMDARELLDRCGFGEDVPVLRGSVAMALEDPEGPWGDDFSNLVEIMEEYFVIPQRDKDSSLSMPIVDVFSGDGDDVVVRGRVESGRLNRGDELVVSGFGQENPGAVVTEIEILDKSIDCAEAGEIAEVHLRNVPKTDIKRGQVLIKKGSPSTSTILRGKVYFSSAEEGGLREPMPFGSIVQFYFNTAEVKCCIFFPSGEYRSGSEQEVVICLNQPIDVKEGDRFVLRAVGKTIGFGNVMEIYE